MFNNTDIRKITDKLVELNIFEKTILIIVFIVFIGMIILLLPKKETISDKTKIFEKIKIFISTDPNFLFSQFGEKIDNKNIHAIIAKEKNVIALILKLKTVNYPELKEQFGKIKIFLNENNYNENIDVIYKGRMVKKVTEYISFFFSEFNIKITSSK